MEIQSRQFSAKERALAALELQRREFHLGCARYRGDPVGYGVNILSWHPTPDQERICELVAEGRRSCVMASHAIGKTSCAGVLANWWYDCFEESITYITAPTWDQALGLTFKEIKRFRLQRKLPGVIQETGWVRDEDKERSLSHYIRAINAEKGEAFQGEHSAPMLIIMEEAVGVPNHIWEATEGLMTSPECRWLAIANPTNEATDFGRATKRPTVNVHRVSVFDHPNIALELEGKDAMIPMAVRLQWLRDMLADHCELAEVGDPDAFEFWSIPTIDAALQGLPVSENERAVKWWYRPNAVFEGRALGRFPRQAFEQVIPRAWLEALPKLPPPAAELPEIGADIARHGDDRTVIATRQGPVLLSCSVLRQLDQDAVLKALRAAITEAAKSDGRNFDPKAIPVRIDVTGGLGTGPADTLLSEGYAIYPVNSSERAEDGEQYPNKRSELWFSCRERARTRQLDFSRIDPDTRAILIDELSTPTWELDNAGRKKVEDKKTIKKRLKQSPDLADGVNLAFAAAVDPPTLTEGTLPGLSDRYGRAKPVGPGTVHHVQ